MSDWDWSAAERARLATFLEQRGLTSGAVTTRRIGDGHSNLTYLVEDADARQVVVRRPPPPPTPPGAHDMLREARLIGALADTTVPVASLLATAGAGEVIDVPFYVMSFALGPVVTTETPSPLDTPGVRRRLGESLVDTLADLHAVDWRVLGLADMGRPEGFNERHLRRMGRLVADDGRPPAHFAVIEGWLGAHVPAESGAAIVHNDYRVGNVVLSAERPGSLVAVLDWELATIGDPLFDLGYFLSSVPDPDTAMTPTERLGSAMLEDGWPTRKELADRYAERTGADLTELAWYTALALWKLAVLYEYGRRRAIRGTGDLYYADQALVQSFLDAAHHTAGLDSSPPPPPEDA